MSYGDATGRDDIGEIPAEEASEIIAGVRKQSAALQLFRTMPMSRKQKKIRVLDFLPTARFVNGDGGLKQTTKAGWEKVTMEAEVIAAIVPIYDEVADDADFDLWGEYRPLIAEAVARALDAAVFFGLDAPDTFSPAIIPTALGFNSGSNRVARGTSTKEDGGIAQDFNLLYSKLEAQGFSPTGNAASITLKGAMRGARDKNGQKLLDVNENDILGRPTSYNLDGMWGTEAGAVEDVSGDFSKGIVGVRADLQYKILDQGVLTDEDGNITHNLPQQDMTALRVTARFAFATVNPANYQQQDKTKRYPWGVLTKPA